MESRNIRIAFMSDLHYSPFPNLACPSRMGHKILQKLEWVVGELNQNIKPDLVLCGGDLINDPKAENAEQLLRELAERFETLKMPCTVIRGNHDPEQEIFTKYFPFHPVSDCSFVRILAFDDVETPGYNAVRTPGDLERMKKDLASWKGICLSLQHTPLTVKGNCVFGYDNAPEILEILKESNCCGTLSGHYHKGEALYEKESLQFFVQSALCEAPFHFSLLEITEGTGITSVKEYAVPEL